MNYQFTRDIGSGASFSCLSKYTASTEADGKWLERPRNKTSVGNFPKWKDIYNSCGAKHSTATIAEAEDTPTHRIFSTAGDDEPTEIWWASIWVFATDLLVRNKQITGDGVPGYNKSTRTHNELLRQKRTSRTWLKTKTGCPDKLWSLHPGSSQSATGPKQTAQADPAFSRGLGPASPQSSWANSTILRFSDYLQIVFDAVSHFITNTNPLLDCVKAKCIHSPNDSPNVHKCSFVHTSSRSRMPAGTEETTSIRVRGLIEWNTHVKHIYLPSFQRVQ